MADKALVDCATGTTTITPLTSEEQAQQTADAAVAADAQWEVLRAERDTRLSACDWTQLPDNGLAPADVDAWATYRQALRDLPANTTDPGNPVWPVPPPTPT